MNEKKAVLVVEDDEDCRALLTQGLEAAGFETQPSYSGNQAIEILRDRTFDLVITDLKMPEGDGFSLLDRLALRKKAPPVIILTADLQMDEDIALQKGAKAVLRKPLDWKELWRRMAGLNVLN